MVDIVVQRGEGDIDGGILENSLANTVIVATQLGRNTIDENSYQDEVTITAIFRPGLETGQILEIHDSYQGESWVGKLKGITIDDTDGIPVVKLDILRPVKE